MHTHMHTHSTRVNPEDVQSHICVATYFVLSETQCNLDLNTHLRCMQTITLQSTQSVSSVSAVCAPVIGAEAGVT